MINSKTLGMTVAAAVFASTAAVAADVTYTFESDYISNSAFDIIPGLDLNTINSSTFSIVTGDTAMSPDDVKEIKNFKIDFANAPDLTISKLMRADNPSIQCPSIGTGGEAYFGTVNNVWIFRTLEVTFCASYAPGMPVADFSYRVSVKDMESFTTNDTPPGMLQLVEGHGYAIDKTPNKVVDNFRTVVAGKTLRLNLLQRPADVEIPGMGPRFGFVMNASWLGHGDKPLVIDAYGFSPSAKAIAIVTEVFPGPMPEDDMTMLRIRYIDETGMEQETPDTDLNYLLEQSYGPLMP
jgi:hypothetical protein